MSHGESHQGRVDHGPTSRWKESKRNVFLLLEEPFSSSAAFLLGLLVTTLIVLSVFIWFFLSLPEYFLNPSTPLLWIEAILIGFFTMEYVLRFACCPSLKTWIIAPSSVIDLLAILPFYIELIFTDVTNISALFIIRALRILRLTRILKLKKYKTLLNSAYFNSCRPRVGVLAPYVPFIEYFSLCFLDQVKCVLPITAFMLAYEFISLGTLVSNLGRILLGMAAAIIGLFLFVEGLKFGLMPLGEKIGIELPKRLPLWGILIVAFLMGIIVTFAEPAIGALSTLGALVPRQEAPYLAFLLGEWNFLLTLFIGIGVGFAAIIGVLRFAYGWTMKTLTIIVISPVMAITCIFMWALPDLRTVIGLAWDCGAITTGPVTVPIVLSLGLGIASAYGGDSTDPAIKSGFGIVTLASALPIFAVQILGVLALTNSKESILAADQEELGKSWIEETPAKEFILAFRAILPLILFLVIVIKVVLRCEIPKLSARQLIDYQMVTHKDDGNTKRDEPSYFPIIGGCISAQIGMIIFNFGLTYGLSELGSQVGQKLPGSFQSIPEVEDSPRFSYGAGLFLVIFFSWFLGFLATRAEPALQVLGRKVEEMGEMTAQVLVFSVAIGVACGISVGVIKIIFDLPLVYFILAGYSVAVVMSLLSSEFLVNLAWDCAGVTTGPVTVPFVLSIGVNLGNAVNVSDGFGILTLASLGPIVSVLLSGILTKAYKWLSARMRPVQVDLP